MQQGNLKYNSIMGVVQYGSTTGNLTALGFGPEFRLLSACRVQGMCELNSIISKPNLITEKNFLAII